jgi:hypothetical protein
MQAMDRRSEDDEDLRKAKKDETRKRFRRPINELVNEIGEGRGEFAFLESVLSLTWTTGIYPPGYNERRKQRIRERYGIEIQDPYYVTQPSTD